MTQVAERVNVFTARRARALELASRYEYAAEPLRLYAALTEAQAATYTEALRALPSLAEVAPFAVRTSVPGVLDVTMRHGTETLREAVLARFHEGDAEASVRAWLAGAELDPADLFVARAAAAPVLEALSSLGWDPAGGEDERRCPACGGLPQLAIFADTGEALLTGQRRLVCSRCATEWTYARMTCVSCRESGGARLPILADESRLPHLRIDACDVCHAYLVTVDIRKDPRAVPLVDEIVALPLDLIAAERGYTKITPNAVGF